MPNNKIPPMFLSGAVDTTRRVPLRRASLSALLIARLFAGRFDRMLAVGVVPTDGSALSVHEFRLTSVPEREEIARTLRRAVHDARTRNAPLSSRIPLHTPNIKAAEDVIDQITLRLHSPKPVNARGMARLRQVLADGAGPFYRYGRGDLNGRLGAALAAL